MAEEGTSRIERALEVLSQLREGGALEALEYSLLKSKALRSDSGLMAAITMHERNGDRSELLDSLRLLPRLERTFSDSDVLIAAVPHSPFATPPALTVLYYAPGMEKIAQATQRMCGGDVCLGRINWDCFPDGFPNLRIEGAELLADRRVVFLACLDRKEVLFEQMAVIYALPRYAAKSFQILLPFFPTATMERVERMGQVATARTMARILSATPHAQRGPTQISIMDIHALQEAFYFSDNVLVRLKSCVRLLQQRLRELPDHDRVAVAFPDEGAYKRFAIRFGAYPTIVCEKRRGPDATRMVTIKEGDPAGKHVVIVDDLVQTGGTLIECARALKTHGASRVSAYVTHGVFPNEAWRKFTADDFDHVWLTDSIPRIAEQLRSRPPFEVLSIAPIVCDLIVRNAGMRAIALEDGRMGAAGAS